jgi:hypothetical protein
LKIFIRNITLQDDGRYTMVFSKDGKDIVQKNMAWCCNGQFTECEDSIFYEIYFEVVKNEKNMPKEIL